ncbi:MAG: histidinol-phosphate aminotransferase family protein [Chloroflexi bacterium]|nr:histidinol-phosphate aminotransferase family protein [Chloroflexota bacterium]
MRLLGLDHIIDFSSSVNPLGPSPKVKEAVARLDLAYYPDPESLELREALAAVTGVAMEQIVPGNGSTDLIHLTASSCLSAGDEAVVLGPTFGEYEAACRVAGASLHTISAEEGRGFSWDIQESCRTVRDLKPGLVFLCNPNNPTGVYLERREVEELAEAARPGMLVLDEAYVSFVDSAWDATELLASGNVMLLRSMTKDYALTGLRLGYALCPPGVAQLLFSRQPTWSVNAAAQAGGLASLSDQEHLIKAQRCVGGARDLIVRELQALRLRFLPPSANFVLVEVGEASSVRRQLLGKGICVRDCTSFGLPRYIRIAIRRKAECAVLLTALKDVLNEGTVAAVE